MGNSLGVIAMFKNESHILDEWIKHYKKEGVCQFILINNGSTDNFMKVLKPHMKNIYLYNDNIKCDQSGLYNKYYNETCKKPSFKKCEWYIVCDLDEFIYSRNPKYKTIPEYLNTLPKNIGQIKIPWKMFGNNGHIKQPKSVIQSFVKRKLYENNSNILGKGLFKSVAIIKIGIHSYEIKNNYLSVTCNLKKDPTWIHTPGNHVLSEKSLFWNQLACNHYQLQSLDFWTNIKCKRGDVNHIKNNRIISKWHNASHLNKIEDNELKNKKY